MDRVYPSKVDAWLIAVLGAAAAVSVYAAVDAGVPSSSGAWVTLASCIALGIVLPTWLVAGTRYVLTQDTLLIMSGPFRRRVPIDDITSVAATRDPRASPALSLDRLRIEYAGGKRAIMISPREKQAFLRDLQARRSGAR